MAPLTHLVFKEIFKVKVSDHVQVNVNVGWVIQCSYK